MRRSKGKEVVSENEDGVETEVSKSVDIPYEILTIMAKSNPTFYKQLSQTNSGWRNEYNNYVSDKDKFFNWLNDQDATFTGNYRPINTRILKNRGEQIGENDIKSKFMLDIFHPKNENMPFNWNFLPHITHLSIKTYRKGKLPLLPKNLVFLKIDPCSVTELDNLPPKIHTLIIVSNRKIKFDPNMYPNLTQYSIKYENISLEKLEEG